jgi:hypothetical protein
MKKINRKGELTQVTLMHNFYEDGYKRAVRLLHAAISPPVLLENNFGIKAELLPVLYSDFY